MPPKSRLLRSACAKDAQEEGQRHTSIEYWAIQLLSPGFLVSAIPCLSDGKMSNHRRYTTPEGLLPKKIKYKYLKFNLAPGQTYFGYTYGKIKATILKYWCKCRVYAWLARYRMSLNSKVQTFPSSTTGGKKQIRKEEEVEKKNIHLWSHLIQQKEAHWCRAPALLQSGEHFSSAYRHAGWAQWLKSKVPRGADRAYKNLSGPTMSVTNQHNLSSNLINKLKKRTPRPINPCFLLAGTKGVELSRFRNV